MYQKKRDILCGALADAGLTPYVPTGAYYVLADCRKLGCATSREAAYKLLDEVGIAAVAGTSFYRDAIGDTPALLLCQRRCGAHRGRQPSAQALHLAPRLASPRLASPRLRARLSRLQPRLRLSLSLLSDSSCVYTAVHRSR